ncbi:uncharacterized protein Gasu_52430 [Galdieria sulphuraria]|uniref:Uncharacterized protein n=1 Tax=Galdieria sulphuraria TaxID=130081 RepID=M2WTA8_GALSU|nr:uncharacterized protein Gasu_52430 [Galdieria sulphuraria]EME27140.1 hypothetical protein Gasu_52430 [Galdieria sulphuraria]|eukprot:XP_005703660.1 hypothetical protein Gasu_52430 [Galdieria sulphuraria]
MSTFIRYPIVGSLLNLSNCPLFHKNLNTVFRRASSFLSCNSIRTFCAAPYVCAPERNFYLLRRSFLYKSHLFNVISSQREHSKWFFIIDF